MANVITIWCNQSFSVYLNQQLKWDLAPPSLINQQLHAAFIWSWSGAVTSPGLLKDPMSVHLSLREEISWVAVISGKLTSLLCCDLPGPEWWNDTGTVKCWSGDTGLTLLRLCCGRAAGLCYSEGWPLCWQDCNRTCHGIMADIGCPLFKSVRVVWIWVTPGTSTVCYTLNKKIMCLIYIKKKTFCIR